MGGSRSRTRMLEGGLARVIADGDANVKWDCGGEKGVRVKQGDAGGEGSRIGNNVDGKNKR